MKLFRGFLTLFTIFCMLQWSSLATNSKKSYIVYLGGHNHNNGLEASKIKESHFEFLGSILGSKERADEAMIYSYNKHINGFSAMLDEDSAAKLAEHPDVVSVFRNKVLKLHTTHSWDFLKLERNGVIDSSSLWKKANYGEGIIIGNLDTGVWPESKSFNDEGYGPIPSKWKGGCENETSVPCNKKLIGAKYFNSAFISEYGSMDPAMNTALDHEGHGSHTLSTAGGNFVPGVSVNGIGNGIAKGGSPRARVASYKVCWTTFIEQGCSEADIMEAFDTAIEDGVDVLSVSLGASATDYYKDAIAIASFHAIKKGITVVFSAGNEGPEPATVTNIAPWLITVGASTIDREFQSWVELSTGLRLKGLSLSKPLPEIRMYPLINAAKAKAENASMSDAMLCIEGALDPEKVRGKIVVCLAGGETESVDKGRVAALSGAAGMILCNDQVSGNHLTAEPHFLPATQISYEDGLRVYAYVDSVMEPLGLITPTAPVVNIRPAPTMASFSSRGPNRITPGILKPDITAPGVDIIAAFTQDTTTDIPYNVESGTSMACPHVSGVVGLLKSIHPDWSPSAIKSAIMTTATSRDNEGQQMTDDYKSEANPFSRGAGDICPNRAADPGLVYDLSPNDYLDFLCASGYSESMIQQLFSGYPYECPKSNNSILDLNYPSITIPKLSGTVTVTRKLKNVGTPGIYAARVRSPVGISVDVQPKVLRFEREGEVQKFQLTVRAQGTNVSKDYVFGELIWVDGKHYVKSPIVVSVA